MAHLDGEITLEELVGECELSRSHFARAFRKTTGRPLAGSWSGALSGQKTCS